MISSRKSANVEKALESLTKQHGKDSIEGVVCHVGKDEDRKKLIQEVREREREGETKERGTLHV